MISKSTKQIFKWNEFKKSDQWDQILTRETCFSCIYSQKCPWDWQLARLGRLHQCWSVQTGFRAAWAPWKEEGNLQTGKQEPDPTVQMQNELRFYLNGSFSVWTSAVSKIRVYDWWHLFSHVCVYIYLKQFSCCLSCVQVCAGVCRCCWLHRYWKHL